MSYEIGDQAAILFRTTTASITFAALFEGAELIPSYQCLITRHLLDGHTRAVESPQISSKSDYLMNRGTVDKLSSFFSIELRTHEQDSQCPTYNHLDTQNTQRVVFFHVHSQTHRMSPFGRNTLSISLSTNITPCLRYIEGPTSLLFPVSQLYLAVEQI